VSHADCEDLADRIRAIRAARGELRGPTLQGPGWGANPRTYAPGDRILVHANLAGGPDRRVCNGSTATVLGVTRDALEVVTDDGQQVQIDAEIVAGYRGDGNPNVSHAWARTVDGAQGGTWRQVHQGQAMIVNKMGSEPKVTFTGAIVLPIVNKAEVMDLSVKTIEVARKGKEGLICADNIRADIKVTFFVRVNKSVDDVLRVAQQIGCVRASQQSTLEELFFRLTEGSAEESAPEPAPELEAVAR